MGEEPTSLATDPGGNFLYVTSYADGSVYAFSIEPGAGSIAAIGGSPFGAGAGALSIAIDPTGTYAYVANETGHSISLYSIDTGTGALAALSGSPLATQTQPESLAVDPAGRFLFAADVTAGNECTSYSITPASGGLTLASSAAAGTFPISVAIDPAGTFAYVANENSNDISAYRSTRRRARSRRSPVRPSQPAAIRARSPSIDGETEAAAENRVTLPAATRAAGRPGG